MISLEDITYRYPLTQHNALTGLSLAIPRGQFCAIIGANSAGKSTLCYALSGFIPRFFRGNFEGTIRVDNTLIHETAPSDLAGRVGLVFDNPFNQISGTRFTVRDEIAFGLENLGLSRHDMLDRVEAILEKVGLNGLADRSPFALSGGQQQRLALASVMVMEPEILVLDEPTSQLDPSGTREVFETLRTLTSQSGITVVLASHKLDRIAAYADRVVALHSGEIALDGLPNEVLTSAELRAMNLRPTRYTEIASAAQSLGLVASNTRLPVDLQEAQNVFALH